MARRKVPYRKPPQQWQFKKGVSGNPHGRPKGKRNLATVLDETLNETVVIVEGGQKRTVTKMEAAVKQIVDKATSGDIHAFRVLSGLARSAEDSTVPDSTSDLAKEDRKVLESLARRFGGVNQTQFHHGDTENMERNKIEHQGNKGHGGGLFK